MDMNSRWSYDSYEFVNIIEDFISSVSSTKKIKV